MLETDALKEKLEMELHRFGPAAGGTFFRRSVF